LQETGVFLAMT